MAKNIEEKYKALSEIDHIISRPGMWVGSTRSEEKQMFLYDDETGKMSMKTVEYVPAMLKLFDEILSNSCDEFRRKDNLGLTKVSVSIDLANGSINICDNGGIPVVKHKDAGMLVPEFIFGQLRTSSNYDDTEDRAVVGTNGVGSSLTNVFSRKFVVTTADNKNKVCVEWTDNMSIKEVNKIEKCKDHYTAVYYELDFDKFAGYGSHMYTTDFGQIVQKRCVDAAAANPGLLVECIISDNGATMSDNSWKFKKFEEYMELYDDFYEEETVFSMKDDKKQIWICPGCDIDVAFVNGAECSRGTHLRSVRLPLGKVVAETLKKKHKIDVAINNISNKYGIFGLFDISNPSYSSQTKEELTTPEELFYKDGTKFSLSDDFLKKASKSEIIDIVVDWHRKKCEVENQAVIRKLNREAKKLLRSEKFVNCNSKKKSEKQLWLTEGDSAKSGFRMCRNSQTQACYCLRGKPRNTLELTATQTMKNQEFADIFNILGLQWGEKADINKLNFGKVVICSDQDVDGHAIAALLLCFFNHWPELFDQGIIVRSLSPIIIATKGKDVQKFYNLDEYRKVQNKLKGYKVLYNKGLGGLTNQFYKEMLQEPIFVKFTRDNMAEIMLKKWFSHGADSAKIRKGMMKDHVSNSETNDIDK